MEVKCNFDNKQKFNRVGKKKKLLIKSILFLDFPGERSLFKEITSVDIE
jgi:hypothetical protein